MHAVQLQSTLTSLPGGYRVSTVFVYGHIQGVGVTAYRILYCEVGEVEQNVRK